jgi:hypothetical protein
MSSRDKAPVARRHRGLFFCYAGDAAARGIEPLAAAVEVSLRGERSASAFPRSRAPAMRGRAGAVAPVRSSRRRIRSAACRVRRCFFAEPGLLGIEFVALFAQLLERIRAARFGPGHSVPFAGRWSPPLPILALRGHVGKWFVGQVSRFCAGVGEVSLAERPSVMRALGPRQGRRGPTIFTGQARQKSLPPSPLRGRAIAVPDPARHPHPSQLLMRRIEHQEERSCTLH